MKSLLLYAVLAFSTLQADYVAKNYDNLIGHLPGFSDDALKMHFKLYQGYVTNTNKLLNSIQELDKNGKAKTPEYAGLKRMFGWEWDGMRLHEYYFDSLGRPEGAPNPNSLDPNSPLFKAIEKDFGSFNNWVEDYKATGLIRGMGWAILYYDTKGDRLINTWINEHDLGHLAGEKPLLPMDVFEHAYITQYGLERGDYIKAFLDNVNWDVVSKRFAEAKGNR